MRDKATKQPTVKMILVPTDFSDCSREALRYAEMLAKTFGAKIVLLHVIDTVSYLVTESMNWSELYRQVERSVHPLLETMRREGEKKGVTILCDLMQGVTYDQIVAKAREIKADLIVMGTHGRTGIQHVLIGSVAERVVRSAACPVLTVRGE